MEFEIYVFPRKVSKKSAVNQLRLEGKIPVVIYNKENSSETGYVLKADFEAILRKLPKGFLPTARFMLTDDAGNKREAIVKDIQHHITSYNVLHLDFQVLAKDSRVKVKVPIQCSNVIDCAGVKAGGFLRYIKRYVQINCLPEDIPTHFDLDVKDLDMSQVKRVEDLQLTGSVRPLADMRETLVALVKR